MTITGAKNNHEGLQSNMAKGVKLKEVAIE
jgi:hypothetical protein